MEGLGPQDSEVSQSHCPDEAVPTPEEEFISTRLRESSLIDEELEDDDEEGSSSDEPDMIDRIGNGIVSGFYAAYTAVKRVAVSEETELMLADVMQIANSLLDSEYNSAQILAAVR